MHETLNIVVCGLSITSSWGNGHATTYRSLLKALHGRGHRTIFLERDAPWYADHRDLPSPDYARVELYSSIDELRDRFGETIRTADLCIVGSDVPEGIKVGEWINQDCNGITGFYDIDTPVTLANLNSGDSTYIRASLIPQYDLYLSFTGGAALNYLEHHYRSPAARALYCSVDPDLYFPEAADGAPQWDLGYMGTYSSDRQPALERLLLTPARTEPNFRLAVAGSMYPDDIGWPPNVLVIEHLPPSEHRSFYNRQRFTLNLTRADMIEAGFSPSVRLFEAAACATPIISDYWQGLEEFFSIGSEILIASDAADVLSFLRLDETECKRIGETARQRVLEKHTSEHRAIELESYYEEARETKTARRGLVTTAS